MSPGDDETEGASPEEEIVELQAGLNEALQHQRAAVERMQETQSEVESLLRRARELLERRKG